MRGRDLGVMIEAFQASCPGSTPGGRTFKAGALARPDGGRAGYKRLPVGRAGHFLDLLADSKSEGRWIRYVPSL